MSSTIHSPNPHPLAGTAPDAVLFAEDALRPLREEAAIWFDIQGNEIGRRTGQGLNVTFTLAEAVSMKDSIFTHNHPDGWNFPDSDPQRAGNSFSDDDFVLAVRVDLLELRAVTPTSRFSLRRPIGGWGIAPGMIRLHHALTMDVVLAEVNLAVRLGTTTLEAAEAARYHEVARRLSVQLGFAYARWEG